jgi:hypothetical protein
MQSTETVLGVPRERGPLLTQSSPERHAVNVACAVRAGGRRKGPVPRALAGGPP